MGVPRCSSHSLALMPRVSFTTLRHFRELCEGGVYSLLVPRSLLQRRPGVFVTFVYATHSTVEAGANVRESGEGLRGAASSSARPTLPSVGFRLAPHICKK